MKRKRWSVELSILYMVLSAFWIFIAWGGISPLRDQGHAVGWTKYGPLIFWIGMFGFSLWNGIRAGKKNRQERIEREHGLDSANNR
jgi:hypothetical protein